MVSCQCFHSCNTRNSSIQICTNPRRETVWRSVYDEGKQQFKIWPNKLRIGSDSLSTVGKRGGCRRQNTGILFQLFSSVRDSKWLQFLCSLFLLWWLCADLSDISVFSFFSLLSCVASQFVSDRFIYFAFLCGGLFAGSTCLFCLSFMSDCGGFSLSHGLLLFITQEI